MKTFFAVVLTLAAAIAGVAAESHTVSFTNK
jgi:hypothetical protein